MQLNTVVLPAPFGPISAVISPRRRIEAQRVDRSEAAEPHGQVLDAQQRIGGALAHPCGLFHGSTAMIVR